MGNGFAVGVFDVDLRPILLVLEHDRRFDHVHWRGIGRGLGASNFPEDMMHFGKALKDLVSLLKDLARLGRRNSWKGGWHIEQIALVKWRHELRAEILIRKQFPDRERNAAERAFRHVIRHKP